MKRFLLSDLCIQTGGPQIFSAVLEGLRIYSGGVSFHTPGLVTHDVHRPHVHDDDELFCLLQGEGWIEINGARVPVCGGEAILVEAGEDHHLISSDHNPLINLWLHADSEGHASQFGEL